MENREIETIIVQLGLIKSKVNGISSSEEALYMMAIEIYTGNAEIYRTRVNVA